MTKLFFSTICLFLFVFQLSSEEPRNKTVCLNMIVKDEEKVITRCLASVKPLIDYWVICDTGSYDKTREIIKEFLKDIPGELHDRPWINFGHNRNEALQLAKNKADYLLIIDADEVFAHEDTFQFPSLNRDFYYIMTRYSGMEYARVQLVNNHLNWEWVGVLHEVLVCPEAKNSGTLLGIQNIVHTDGARSQDPQKYLKDAKLLESALEKEPHNTRTVFYLAQSYRDAGEHAKALETYEKRVKMGGWAEEVFWAMLQVAILQENLDYPEETITNSYYQAFNYRPSRIEPLYRLSNYYRRHGNYMLGYLVAKLAQPIPPSKDLLFVEKWVNEFGIPLEIAICAYWIGKYEESQQMSITLMNNPTIPDSIRECAEKNLSFANAKLVSSYIQSLPTEQPQKLAQEFPLAAQ